MKPITIDTGFRIQAILAFLSMEFDLADTDIGLQYFVKSL
jgi:hypothetical protein